MSQSRSRDAAAMSRHFHNASKAIAALRGRQLLWQDDVSQDAEARLEVRVGHQVDPVDCLDDAELSSAIDVAKALDDLQNALRTAEELFIKLEPHSVARP